MHTAALLSNKPDGDIRLGEFESGKHCYMYPKGRIVRMRIRLMRTGHDAAVGACETN
jgi:hypothetical protein